MKSLCIERDLTQKVQDKFRNDLVRDFVRTADPENEGQIVEEAAATAISIVRRQRTMIGRANMVVDILFSQLANALEFGEDVEAQIIDETKDDQSSRRRSIMLKAVALPNHASTILKLSSALKTLIALERQAYNIMDEAEHTESRFIEDFKKHMKMISNQPRKPLSPVWAVKLP